MTNIKTKCISPTISKERLDKEFLYSLYSTFRYKDTITKSLINNFKNSVKKYIDNTNTPTNSTLYTYLEEGVIEKFLERTGLTVPIDEVDAPDDFEATEINDKDSHEISAADSIDNEVMYTLSHVPKTINGQLVLNSFGTIEYHDEGEVWKALLYVGNSVFNKGRIDFKAFKNAIKQHAITFPILNDVLNENLSNMFILNIIGEKAKSDLQHKLISTIARPIMTFVNFTIDSFGDNTEFSTYLTNEISKEDFKRTLINKLKENRELIKVTKDEDYVWNITKLKDYFKFDDNNKVWVLANKDFHKQLGINISTVSEDLQKRISNYFNFIIKSSVVIDNNNQEIEANVKFKADVFNLYSKAMKEQREQTIERYALSFITKNFKKLYAAVNINHQIRIQRMYRGVGIVGVAGGIETFKEGVLALAKQDPIFQYLPYIQFIKGTKTDIFKRIVLNNKYSIVDTLINNNENESPHNFDAIKLLKFRLMLSAPTLQTFKGEVKGVDDLSSYREFPFYSVTNSSNKTNKIVSGIEYRDIKGNYRVHDNKALNLENTIAKSEVNRIVHYTNKLLTIINNNSKMKRYKNNDYFRKVMNMYALVSNHQKEIDSLMFVKVDDIQTLSQEQKDKIKVLTDVLPNPKYFTIVEDTVSVTNDAIYKHINKLYEQQIDLEVKHLQSEIINNGLFVDTNSADISLIERLQFLPAEYIYNQLPVNTYTATEQFIPSNNKALSDNRKLFNILLVLATKYSEYSFREAIERYKADLDTEADANKANVNRLFAALNDKEVAFEDKPLWYHRSNLDKNNISLNSPVTYEILSKLLSKINRNLNTIEKKYYLRTTDNTITIIQFNDDVDLQKIAKDIFNAYTKWYHYNYVFNMYDDIQLTLGDMSSYFKKDKETRWNVETTFTNFYKRAKMVISPIVPHTDNVTLNGVLHTNFKNIVLKSNKTYSPQARETTINLNRQVFESNAKVNSDVKFLTFLLGKYVDLEGTNIYEYNSKLSREKQRKLNAEFLVKYNDPLLREEIDAMFQKYGINTSYFNIDLTDAYDVGTLMFELKRLLLYNTNNSVISQSLADRLAKWLEEPLNTPITIFGVTYSNPKRRYTAYNLDDFRTELINKRAINDLTEFDKLMLYLRKDITVGFLSDDTLNNRTLFTDKNAMRVLLPTDIAGTPLELLRVFMEIHDIDRASHDSAIKTPLSAAYAIDFWNLAKNNDASTIWNILKEETVDNVLTIPFTHIGEQTAQTHSDKSILSSQSKSLIFIAQKAIEYLHRYVDGSYIDKDVEKYTGEDLYEQLQEAWENIYKHKITEFAREVYVNGEVNTEKLANFILRTLKVSNNLKEEDVVSLLTNKQLLIEDLNNLKGDEQLSESPNETTISKIDELITILTDNKLLANDNKKLELINGLVELKVKNSGFTDVTNINNWLLKFVIPIFYNTNANKMDSVLASKINNLLRLKGNGVKGALTPNVDIVETKYIDNSLESSLVLVDPADWTPDMELQSTSIRDSKVTPDQIAVSWNFKDNKELFFEYLVDDKGNYLLDSKGNRRSIATDNHYSKITTYQRTEVDIDPTIHPAYDSTRHKKVVYQYSTKDGKTYYSLITKEKVDLDILDFCKPQSEGHTISNGNNVITYPVLDLNRIPKQMLQGFANRIPTQSPNSMSYFQIAAFFHNKTRSTVAAPAEFIVRMGSDFDIDTLYSLIYNGYYDAEDNSFKLYTDEKDSKSAYNKVLDIYITVLTNPSNLQLILAPLDFGISHGEEGGNPLQISKQELIAEINDKGATEVLNKYGTAATIAKLSQSDNYTYNPLSSLTNHLKYVAALSSGAGIGWAALHQVFNTLVELKGEKVLANITYRNSIVDESNNPIVLNKDISIPQLVYSKFGKLKGMDRSTMVSIFVDNEKEQIADRTNMTTFTLNAIAGFNAMGLDTAHIQAIISTPFIKELEKNTIELGRTQGLYKTLYNYDYSGIEFDSDKQKYKLSVSDITLEQLIEADNTTPQTFDLKTLLLYIGNNNTEYDTKDKSIGLEILLLYYEAGRLGGELSTIQTLLNTDAQGAGKNYSTIIQKYRKLEDIFSEKVITNILSVFGDTYYINYTPSIRVYDSNYHTYSEPYDIISLYVSGLVSGINSITYKQGATSEKIATTISLIDDYEGAINHFVNNTTTNDYSKYSSTLFNILLTIHKNNKKVNVLPILKYLLLSHRFRPYTFAVGEVEAILNNVSKKDISRVKAMLIGISNNVDFVFIDNLLFYPKSHKGYALLALKLGVDTFKDFFPYGTSVWNNTLNAIYFNTGKRLSKEEDLIAFTKLFRAYNILKNNLVNNDYLSNVAKGKQMDIAISKADKNTYYFLNSINIESRGKVVITYTKTDNLVDEATYFEKVHNLFKDMLLDNTLIADTGIRYKDLANYLAEYYLLVNGNNYEFRNLGKLIPADVLARNPIAQKIANTDFNTMDYEYMSSNNKALIIFILKHNPALLAVKYTSEYSDNFKRLLNGIYEINSKSGENPDFYYDSKQNNMYVKTKHLYVKELSSTPIKEGIDNQYVLVNKVVQPKGVTVYSIDNINIPKLITNNIEDMNELSRLTNEFKQYIEQQIVNNSDKDLNTTIKDTVKEILDNNPIMKIYLINTKKKVLKSSNNWEYTDNLITALTELREEYSKEDTPPPLKIFVLPNKTITNTSNDIYEEADVVEIIEDASPTSTNIKPQDLTNHSGGAEKYDTYWDNIGREFGVKNHIHYTVEYYNKLSNQEKTKYDNMYQQAIKWLGRGIIDKDTYNGKLVRRDMVQAEKADSIFAISEIVKPNIKGRKGYVNKTNHPIVEGGTGYAVASGILQNKTVYVFNQDSNYGYDIGWYVWDSNTNDFIQIDTPILTNNFAGIGSHTHETKIGKQAIRDVYEKTLISPTNQENNNDYTYQDFARDNKGIEVLVHYSKYNKPFKATITGEVETIVEVSDETGKHRLVGIQVKSSTGKLLPVTSLYEIEGDVINTDKLTDKSNRIDEKVTSTSFININQVDVVKEFTKNTPSNPDTIFIVDDLDNLSETKQATLQKQNVFTVTPIQSTDKKAIVKASVSNKFIGYGEGIDGSSTEYYRQQVGNLANVGDYNPNDVVFVSIVGRRGSEKVRKEQQDKTIREALKAIEQGAILITDNKAYVESSNYNEGEKRLAWDLKGKGYNYSEQTIDGQVLGVWSKSNSKSTIDIAKQYNKPIFVFNQSPTQTYPVGWYSLEKKQDTFIPTNPPTLTPNYLGIANNVNDVGKQAIRDLYEKTYGTDNTLNQAIRALEAGATVITNNDDSINIHLKNKGYTSVYQEVKGVIKTVWSNPNHSKSNSSTLATQIYNKLGDKTASEYVVLPKDLGGDNKDIFGVLDKFSKENPNGIIAYRVNTKKATNKEKDRLLQNLQEQNAIGNPFDWNKHGVEKATKMFIDWVLNGNNYNEPLATDKYRQAILDKIKSSKNEKILYYDEFNRPTHATALDYLFNKYDWGYKGIEINSYQDDLGFALTNPIFTTPTGYEWNREWTPKQKEWRAYMSNGIVFNNERYRDVEEAYQKNKDKYPIGEARDNFMTNLLVIKLQTYPLLVEKIKERGGLVFINNSTHNPTNGKNYWETSHSNGFIKALSKAYEQVTSKIESKNISITPEYYTKDTPKSNPNTAYVFTEHINGIGTDRSGGGSAIIRGNPNAIGIVTKKRYVYQEDRDTTDIEEGYNQNFQDTDEDFELFKQVNINQFAKLDKYDSIVFPQGFGTGLAAMPKRLALWLQQELKDRYGLITELNPTKTGLLSIGVVGDFVNSMAQENESTIPTFTFTYKGKTIPTRFRLSTDQTRALERLIDFYDDPDRDIITLQGAAGTGKTAIVGYLQNYVDDKVLYSAPTHAATLELAFGTAATGNRDFPLTSKQLVVETDFGYTLGFEAKQTLGYGKLIVVDEVSMLNNEDYDKLLKLLSDKSNGYKLLFIGDEKQTPEVAKAILIGKDKNNNDVYGKYISKAFFEHETISLNTVHRTSNEGMKKIYQATRDTNQHIMYVPLKNTEHIHFTHNTRAIEIAYRNIVLLDPENTDYIAYTNDEVSNHNKATREEIFKRKGIIQKDDIVMGYIGYKTKKIKGGNIANSVSYTVTDVTLQHNKGNLETVKQLIKSPTFDSSLIDFFVGYKIEATSKRITSLINIGFKLPFISRTIYIPLSNKDAIEHNVSKELMDYNNTILSIMFERLIELTSTAKAIKDKAVAKKAWGAVFTYKTNLSHYINSIDLGNSYIYDIDNKKFIYYDTKDNETINRILDKYKKLGLNHKDYIIEKGIDYGHAITIHKAQGRTTKNVFFNAGSIPNTDIKLFKKVDGEIYPIGTENQALYYVGISRASDTLYVVTGNKKTETIDITPNISSQLNEDNNAKEIENNCG